MSDYHYYGYDDDEEETFERQIYLDSDEDDEAEDSDEKRSYSGSDDDESMPEEPSEPSSSGKQRKPRTSKTASGRSRSKAAQEDAVAAAALSDQEAENLKVPTARHQLRELANLKPSPSLHPCPACGQIFSRRRILDSHMMMHSDLGDIMALYYSENDRQLTMETAKEEFSDMADYFKLNEFREPIKYDGEEGTMEFDALAMPGSSTAHSSTTYSSSAMDAQSSAFMHHPKMTADEEMMETDIQQASSSKPYLLQDVERATKESYHIRPTSPTTNSEAVINEITCNATYNNGKVHTFHFDENGKQVASLLRYDHASRFLRSHEYLFDADAKHLFSAYDGLAAAYFSAGSKRAVADDKDPEEDGESDEETKPEKSLLRKLAPLRPRPIYDNEETDYGGEDALGHVDDEDSDLETRLNLESRRFRNSDRIDGILADADVLDEDDEFMFGDDFDEEEEGDFIPPIPHCSICPHGAGPTFFKITDLIIHRLSEHGNSVEKIVVAAKADVPGVEFCAMAQCPFCHMQTSDPNYHLLHLLAVHIRQLCAPHNSSIAAVSVFLRNGTDLDALVLEMIVHDIYFLCQKPDLSPLMWRTATSCPPDIKVKEECKPDMPKLEPLDPVPQQ